MATNRALRLAAVTAVSAAALVLRKRTSELGSVYTLYQYRGPWCASGYRGHKSNGDYGVIVLRLGQTTIMTTYSGETVCNSLKSRDDGSYTVDSCPAQGGVCPTNCSSCPESYVKHFALDTCYEGWLLSQGGPPEDCPPYGAQQRCKNVDKVDVGLARWCSRWPDHGEVEREITGYGGEYGVAVSVGGTSGGSDAGKAGGDRGIGRGGGGGTREVRGGSSGGGGGANGIAADLDTSTEVAVHNEGSSSSSETIHKGLKRGRSSSDGATRGTSSSGSHAVSTEVNHNKGGGTSSSKMMHKADGVGGGDSGSDSGREGGGNVGDGGSSSGSGIGSASGTTVKEDDAGGGDGELKVVSGGVEGSGGDGELKVVSAGSGNHDGAGVGVGPDQSGGATATDTTTTKVAITNEAATSPSTGKGGASDTQTPTTTLAMTTAATTVTTTQWGGSMETWADDDKGEWEDLDEIAGDVNYDAVLVKMGGHCGPKGQLLSKDVKHVSDCAALAEGAKVTSFSVGRNIHHGQCYADTLVVDKALVDAWEADKANPPCPEPGGWVEDKNFDFYFLVEEEGSAVFFTSDPLLQS